MSKGISVKPMTAAEMRRIIDALGTTQVGLAAFLQVNGSTVRRWIAKEDAAPIPHAVALLLRVMIRHNIVLDEFNQPTESTK